MQNFERIHSQAITVSGVLPRAGVPELGFGLEQVKPSWLIPVGAAVLLATKGTVSGGKTFGGTRVEVPGINHDTTLKVKHSHQELTTNCILHVHAKASALLQPNFCLGL